MELNGITIPEDRIASFCVRNQIRRLSLFGSILYEDFGLHSDIDVLVEFNAGKTPGYFGFAGMQLELSALLGRRVDLRTPEDLSQYFRSAVVREALVQYAA